MKEKAAKECASFFKRNPLYDPMFIEMKKKYEKYGKLTGKVRLKKVTEEEAQALSGILGKHVPLGDFQFSIVELQKALHETKYRGVEAEALLQAYYGGKLLSNRQRREAAKESKELFWESLLQELENQLGRDAKGLCWLYAAWEQRMYGYQRIMKSAGEIKETLVAVCRALEYLSSGNDRIRLAILGAEITKNPHYFDRTNAAGRLLIDALRFLYKVEEPKGQEEILSLYYLAGILPDDISSFTTCYGIHFYEESGEHEAYRYFIEKGEKYVVTLSNFGRLVSADSARKKVFIIENQMVFSQICEEMHGREYALLCTSGQPKTASLLLIDLLVQSGCTLYYCGDMDPEGVEIADRIVARNPGQILPWRMTETEYYSSMAEEKLSEARLKKLEKIQNVQLQRLAQVIKKEKRAGYQEHIIDRMVCDILDSEK